MKIQKLFFVFGIFSFYTISFAIAQNLKESSISLPIDEKVRYGKLDNGLTYYIRHNELPKERVDFYIAQKVGSVLEKDNQSGLAHFLEHMAFNGTKNFPGKTMINYLETIGVKFGENLNAYTGFDRTVYNISNVPVVRESVLDSCLLILHDWSGFISFEQSEIDSERGVIREEMRTRAGASFRVIEKLLPQIMPGSQYAKRLPIGKEEVVMNFKRQELVDYYHEWYRPDLQGIIIVGDIDVDKVEAKIKTLFSDIPKPINPSKRVYYPVPDNQEPLVGIASDKEATSTQIAISFKHDVLSREQKSTIQGVLHSYIVQIGASIINERLNEIVEKPNPPFLYAMEDDSEFYVAETKDAWNAVALAKEGGVKEAFTTLVQETERLNRFGFTRPEYERAKINIVKRYEDAFQEREKQRNRTYAHEYVEHFTKGGYIPGIEVEFNIINEIANSISMEIVQEEVQKLIGNENIVIALTYPDKPGLRNPSTQDLLSWFEVARTAELTPYEDKVSNEPLISKLPKPGKIISAKQYEKFNTIDYVLSNGVKVIVKPTNFKNNQILIAATSPGGSSLFPKSEIENIKAYSSFVDVGGVGNFSNIELLKKLAGKSVSLTPTISLTTEGFSGECTVADFETEMQLLYLYFTAPHSDEEAFLSAKERLKSRLESRDVDPYIALTDTLQRAIYGNNSRTKRLMASDLDAVNYETIMKWYKDRYKNASDFTFVFVGNLDAETLEPLMEQYLATLPSIKRKEKPGDVDMSYLPGEYANVFKKQVENPKATVVDIYTGNLDYTLKNRLEMSMLSQILKIVYTETIREEEGGTYGVSVYGNISEYPSGQMMLQMSFDTNEEKMLHLNSLVIQKFEELAAQGPKSEDFSKVKEFMAKKHKENERENSYWKSVLLKYAQTGEDDYSDYSDILNAITQENVQQLAQEIINQKGLKIVILNGVKE